LAPIQNAPDRADYYAALGALKLASGDASAAEAAYKNAIARDPKSDQAHVALGQFYFSQRRTAEAAAEMRAGAELDAHAVPPRVFLGRIYAETGKLDDAEKTFKELKTIEGGSETAAPPQSRVPQVELR